MIKIIVLTFLFLVSLSAQAKYIECSDCSSETNFYNKARSELDLIEGRSYISVGNTMTGKISKYLVIYQPGDMSAGERPLLKVGKVTVDSHTQSLFDDAVYYRNQIWEYIDGSVSVPNDVALSAWQLAGNSVFQRDIAIYYNENQSFTEAVGNYVLVLLNLGGKVVGANFVVPVKFSDGSYANFKINGVDLNGDVIFEFMNAVDSFGNPIPNDANQLAGQYRMDTQNMNHFRTTVNRFRFVLKAPAVSQGTVIITDCYLVPETKEVVCTKTEGTNLP